MASIFRTGQRLWLFVHGERVSVRVQSHDQDMITINLGPDLIIQKGVVVPIGCPVPRGFTLYWMQVLNPPNSLGRNVVLRRNPNAGANFHRRGWRVNVPLPAKIKRTGATHFIESRIANLSMEGAFLESAASIAVGDVLDLHVTIPNTPPCQLSARVCRLAPQVSTDSPFNSADQAVSGAGLAFLKIPSETRTALTHFLWKTIRETHGSSIHIHRD